MWWCGNFYTRQSTPVESGGQKNVPIGQATGSHDFPPSCQVWSCCGSPVTRCWFYLQQSFGVQTYGFFHLRSDFGFKHMETSESVLVSKLLFIVLSSISAWSPMITWCSRKLLPCSFKQSQVNWKGVYVSMVQVLVRGSYTLHVACSSSIIYSVSWQGFDFWSSTSQKFLESWNKPINQLPLVVPSFPFARWDVHILTAMYSLPGFEDFLKLDPFDFFWGSKGSNEIRWLIICLESSSWNLVNFLLSCWSWRWQCFLGAPKEIILKFKSKICGTFPNLCF